MLRVKFLSFLREIWKTKTRFFSIFAIVAIGVGFFAGVRATEPDMRASVNKYYTDHRLSHFVLTSPLGFDLDDLDDIEEQLTEYLHNDADITASGGYSVDITTAHPEKGEVAFRVMSYNGYINTLEVVEGSMPRLENECAVLAQNNSAPYKIGDKITLSHDLLKQEEFTVTALVNSPMYMSKMQFGVTNVGSGSLSGAIYMPELAFQPFYYTTAYIYDTYLAEREAYTSRFDSAYNRLEEAVDALCAEREEYFRATDKNDYTDLNLDAVSPKLQKKAEKLNKTYLSLMEEKAQIENEASFLAQAQALFDQRDATVITGEYNYSAYFAALLRRQSYDENGLPIAQYTPEGIYNLVTAGNYSVDDYMYYKYERYILNIINDAQKEDFNKKLEKYNKSLTNFKADLISVISNVDKLYYVTKMEDYPAYTEYGLNAERLGNIASIFPVFFLIVSALVCLTTMTRMVDENRTDIGTKKALGISSGQVLTHYVMYALLASVLGAVVGVAVGFKLFPSVIINTYSMLYVLPKISLPFRGGIAFGSVAVTLICILLTVIFSCAKELMHQPAQLLRPKAPAKGKKILIERISFVWNRFTFIQKVTLRNIFRYKKRMIMTVLGIAGCTALVLTAFGLRDSISDIVRLQFDEIANYDMTVSFDERYKAEFALNEQCDDHLVVMQKTVTAKSPVRTMEVTVMATEEPARLSEFITLRERKSKAPLILADSDVIITEKTATLLDVREGDIISLGSGEENMRDFFVFGITENYANHYVYTSASLYGEYDFNTALCKAEDVRKSSEELLKQEGILAVIGMDEQKQNFEDILKILDAVILVLIISAGLLAFVVLFNLSNININERRREIATLKVLGFGGMQTGAYIIRENIILSLMGTLVGLLFGRALTAFVIQSAEIDLVMFGRTVYPESFILSAVITMVFAVVISLLMNIRIKKIDMVESLKSVE